MGPCAAAGRRTDDPFAQSRCLRGNELDVEAVSVPAREIGERRPGTLVPREELS